jgi:hypothetical protein
MLLRRRANAEVVCATQCRFTSSPKIAIRLANFIMLASFSFENTILAPVPRLYRNGLSKSSETDLALSGRRLCGFVEGKAESRRIHIESRLQNMFNIIFCPGHII